MMREPSLTEFLLARITEDEAVAGEAQPGPWGGGGEEAAVWGGDDSRDGIAHASWEYDERSGANFLHIARHDPARVLAECTAKRRIVERLEPITEADDGCQCAFCPILREMAVPYADHPDYKDEWKP